MAKRTLRCSICKEEGHNKRSCNYKSLEGKELVKEKDLVVFAWSDPGNEDIRLLGSDAGIRVYHKNYPDPRAVMGLKSKEHWPQLISDPKKALDFLKNNINTKIRLALPAALQMFEAKDFHYFYPQDAKEFTPTLNPSCSVVFTAETPLATEGLYDLEEPAIQVDM